MSFRDITEAILMDEKPCGCLSGGHALANGVLVYSNAPFWKRHPGDLEMCRLCGAVWRVNERLGRGR